MALLHLPRTNPRLHGEVQRQAREPALKPRAVSRARRERSCTDAREGGREEASWVERRRACRTTLTKVKPDWSDVREESLGLTLTQPSTHQPANWAQDEIRLGNI